MIEVKDGDRVLTCIDCGHDYVYTRGEQSFFANQGLHEPKRCKPCRAKKRERNQQREQ